jgi:hypothetical protein
VLSQAPPERLEHQRLIVISRSEDADAKRRASLLRVGGEGPHRRRATEQGK